MKKRKLGFLCILLTTILLGGIPGMAKPVYAEDTRTPVSAVEAVSDISATAVYAKPVARPLFTVTKGAPAYIASGVWSKKNGDAWEDIYSGTFSAGTWRCRVQLRTDAETGGADHKIAEDATLLIDGAAWQATSDVVLKETYSFRWYVSAPFEIVSTGELTFSGNYSIGRSPVQVPIESFSVAGSADGGTLPYTFSKVSGPEWLSVSSDGTVFGTPLAPETNPRLVIKVTDDAGASQEIHIPVGDSYIPGSGRTPVTKVEAVSNMSSIAVHERPIKYPVFTVTKGSPAYLTGVVWSRKNGDTMEDVYSGTFTRDIWQCRAQLRTDADSGGAGYKIMEDTTLFVDGVQWEAVSNVVMGETYSFRWYVSKPFRINQVLKGTVRIKGTVKHYGDLLDLAYSGGIEVIPPERLHYEWQISSNKTSWTNIIGETGDTYQTPAEGTETVFYRVRVTADDFEGALYSDIRAVTPPSVTAPIEGKVYAIQDHESEAYYAVGETITATAKNSAGVEMTMDGMTYLWQHRPDDQSEWEYIPGAEGKTYTPMDDVETHWIRVEVSCRQLAGAIYSRSKWVDWRDTVHQIQFDVQGHGEVPDWQSIKRGRYVQKPEDPAEAGWIFGGWYEEPACITPYDFEKPVTEAMILYAKWTQAPHPVPSDAVYIVTAGSLNVRAEAGADAERLGGLAYGDVIQAKAVFEEWVEIPFEGKDGWVNSAYLALTYSAGTAVPPATYTVKSGALTVREDISKESARIGGLKAGDQILVTGKRSDPDGRVWAVLDYAAGDGTHRLGYVLAEFVEGETLKTDTANVEITLPEFPEDLSLHAASAVPVIADGGTVTVPAEKIGENENSELILIAYPDDGENFSEITAEKIRLPEGCGYVVRSVTPQADGGIVITLAPEKKITYTVQNEGGIAFTKGSGDTLTVTVKRSEADETCFGHFQEVQLDGSTLSPDAYEARAGSTVVTIRPQTLEMLPAGTHALAVLFDDGRADAEVTVKAAEPAGENDPEDPKLQPEEPSGEPADQTAEKDPAGGKKQNDEIEKQNAGTDKKDEAVRTKTITPVKTSGSAAPATGDRQQTGLWCVLLLTAFSALCMAAGKLKTRK